MGAAANELMQRRGGRLTRRVTGDTGIDVILETDSSAVWRGVPDAWVGQQAYFPSGLPASPPPDSRSGWSQWVIAEGGMPCGTHHSSVTLVASAPATVVVGPPRIEVVDSWEIDGGAVVMLPAAGAEVTPRGFSIELRPQHDFSVVSGIPQPDGVADPMMCVYSLATKEVEQFHMQAAGTGSWVYRWKVLFDIFVDGKARELDPHTAKVPYFELGSPAAADTYIWHEGEARWLSVGAP